MITINKMEKTRQTKQKQIIMDYLMNTKEHPSAEMVFQEVKKTLPQISRATVYRNLDLFCESGEIIVIDTDIKRFDADISRHDHFICENCGQIIDLPAKKNKKIKIPNVGNVMRQAINYYGICNKCK